MKKIAVIASTVAVVATLIPGVAHADPNIIIGSSGNYISGIEKHKYGKLSGGAITDARFVNIETTVAWSQVANGSQDANIRRWANALEGHGNRLVSFSHEPMAKQNIHWGTASSFIAAWRHVVSVFDSQGATNVEWVWNVTSQAFRVPSSSPEYGAKWYPGDSWVDDVAGEAYNRYQCPSSTNNSFAERIKGIFAFAKQHNKKMLVAEYASNSFGGRDDWLRAAKSFMASNRSHFRGAFYFNSSGSEAGQCRWYLNSAEQSIVRSMETL